MMKKNNPISITAFFIVLYVARNAVPYAIYPLMLLLFPFTLYQFINIKSTKQALIKSIKIFSPIVLLILIELVALFCTVYPLKGLPLNFLKEITFISIFMFLLSFHVQNKHDFKQLMQYIGNYFILFSIIVSIAGLWKFFYSPTFFSYHYVDGALRFKWGVSLVSDYNFFSLFLFNGLVLGLYKILYVPAKIKHKTLFLIALQVIVFAVFLSGSRRLYIIMGGFFLVCLFLLIPYLFKKAFSNSGSYKYLPIFLMLFVFNSGIFYSFLSYFPMISKKTEKIFFFDSELVNTNISSIAVRINSATSSYIVKNENIMKIVPLTASRQELWQLGRKIYSEYTIAQKITGCGFSFLAVFQKETGNYFYPHHLFLSILLFSGIFGLILYLALLFWCSYIYLFHFKDLGVFFFLFLVNFTFGFFSFTDFFGATFYALLIILPLLYRFSLQK